MNWVVFVLLLVPVFATGAKKVENFSECQVGQECYFDLPGLQCADGTQSFFTYTKRKGARNLLVYLAGGGGCWNKSTCKKGFAKPLTRIEPHNNWSTGKGIENASDPYNPFRSEYNIVTIPYCTGDGHTGSRVATYESGYRVRHVGYNNVRTIFNYIRNNHEQPEKAVMVGCSAGGIGATLHLSNFVDTFPSSDHYVVNDAGLPFKPPHVYSSKYKAIMKSWGADKNLPDVTPAVNDFGDLLRYNKNHYPDVRYGFISSYRDLVMTFFAMQVGSPNHMQAVKRNIIDVSDNDLGLSVPLQKVFYTESRRHCHTDKDIGTIYSMGTSLGSWLTAMIDDDDRGFKNVRPDLHHPVNSAEDSNEKIITDIAEIQKHF